MAEIFAKAPLSFVRSGVANLPNGYLSYVGNGSSSWSYTASSYVNYAHYFNVADTDINSSGSYNRYIGRSLRCLQE